MRIQHHGAVNGVTGSCHQLHINEQQSLLIDCGLFQGVETSGRASADHLNIDFDICGVTALIVTHCHIDHVGRIPYLLAAGFKGPIYATEATAALLPLIIEDALKVGVTRDQKLIDVCLSLLEKQLRPMPYKQWQAISATSPVKLKFQPAGHILGSAYVEVELGTASDRHRVVFSGDLGAPYAPLLPAPKAPYRADTLVIESTYGDKNHEHRRDRSRYLRSIIEKAVADNGVVLIPAFSIGRTQELLYEIEQFVYQDLSKGVENSPWSAMEVIVDSPMAASFTQQYRSFKQLWDKEAHRKLAQGRHPLNFEQLYTIDSHKEHLSVVNYLARRDKPAIVIAASGMCSGGRIVNYLKTFLGDPKADVLFVGYQAQGTPGRIIQKYGARGGYVDLDDQRYDIRARVHTISGYSAHTDQFGLINFVKRMRHKPKQIRIVHGDEDAKKALSAEYQALFPQADIVIPKS